MTLTEEKEAMRKLIAAADAVIAAQAALDRATEAYEAERALAEQVLRGEKP